MIRKIFQDAESIRSGHSHVTSQPVSFPPHPIPGRLLSRSIGMPSRRNGPPSIWDTHGKSRNVFADPVASSTGPYPQELNPWSSGISEPIHSSTARIASALNRIIHNSDFKRKISLEEHKAQKKRTVSSWKTDRLPDLRVLPGHWSQRFCRELCRPILCL